MFGKITQRSRYVIVGYIPVAQEILSVLRVYFMNGGSCRRYYDYDPPFIISYFHFHFCSDQNW